MNGIGVWHEPFDKKIVSWVNYFSDRNMLILNFYAKNCNALTFLIAVIGRLVKRSISNRFSSLNVLYYAINDVNNGFEKITEIGADKKLINIQALIKKSGSSKYILKILWILFIMVIHYKKYRNKFLYFRDSINGNKFWESYYKK